MPATDPARVSLETKPLFWNPCECWALKLGYRSDAVFNRRMHNRRQNIDRVSLFANEGVLYINLWRLVEVYGFVGGFRASFASAFPLTGGTGTNEFIRATFDSQVIGGFGATALLWERGFGRWGVGTLSLMAQYEDTGRAHTQILNHNGLPTADRIGLRYREGQVSFGWAQRWDRLSPYITLNWAKAGCLLDGDRVIEGVWLNNEFKTRRKLGYAFGATFASGAVTVSGEIRCLIENAGTLMVDMAF